MTEPSVSKRVFLTLPDVVYQHLEDWANSQGRPVANLGAFIVEKAVEQAKAEGVFTPKEITAGKADSKTDK
ncbi:MAG: hypothetical protein WA947_13275 [Phormidesmis sp.]